MNADFSGLGVALATPFTPEGTLDLPAYRNLVRRVAAHADVLVVLGTTGEAPTIHGTERDTLIAATLEEAGGKRVVAGTGSNDTAAAAAMTRRAQELGVHGALVVTPYYNKPTPRGLAAHYAALADAAPGLPLIAYNVPGRTGLNVLPGGLALLWENPQVVAVKESSGNLAQIAEIARTLPPGKQLISGDDGFALASIAVGAVGLTSVLGNLLPRESKALVDLARAGRMEEARALNARLLPLMDALFLESSPGPLKAGLRLMGLAGDTLRLPLVPPEPATVGRMKAALRGLGVDLPGVE
ncbi:MAG: 4-hydroxy-tetrahydrodipicolinate synthase [Acidobacteria bacterium]|nr:4-hydroxy-tetrahydrodipicolinate synthase [Acidobacteriota bacterium]